MFLTKKFGVFNNKVSSLYKGIFDFEVIYLILYSTMPLNISIIIYFQFKILI